MKSTKLLPFCLTMCLATSGFAQQQPRNSDIQNIGSRDINRGEINFISLEKEVALGRQLSAEFERQIKLSDNAAVNEYVNRLGQNIARNSDARIPMTFKVADSNDVESLAFPGGFVYISTGTILMMDNEAELASVLAQQVAHIAARHFTQNESKAQLVNRSSLPVTFQSGQGRPALGQIPFDGREQFARFVRQQVMEADYLGLQYLYKAGYQPNAANAFLRKLQALKPPPNSNVLSEMFNPDPPVADRIAANQKTIELILRVRSDNVVTTPEFDSIKAQLKN